MYYTNDAAVLVGSFWLAPKEWKVVDALTTGEKRGAMTLPALCITPSIGLPRQLKLDILAGVEESWRDGGQKKN